MQMNGTTIEQIWGSPKINEVTLYNLLHMKSGLHDYDDAEIQTWTLEHPDGDITPIDFLYEVEKTPYIPQGEVVIYSSVGYMMLGLALA